MYNANYTTNYIQRALNFDVRRIDWESHISESPGGKSVKKEAKSVKKRKNASKSIKWRQKKSKCAT